MIPVGKAGDSEVCLPMWEVTFAESKRWRTTVSCLHGIPSVIWCDVQCTMVTVQCSCTCDALARLSANDNFLTHNTVEQMRLSRA